MSRRLINISKRHLEKNYIIYFILGVFIIVGIIIGSIIILKLDGTEEINLMSYFNWIFNYIGSEGYTSIDIFKSSLFSNMKILLIIWTLGFISFGTFIIPLIICFKGVSIGFTVGFFIKSFGFKGFSFSILGLLPNYLIVFPVFLIMGTISILKSISHTNLKKSKCKSIDLSDYGIILLIFFCVILFTTFLEGFFVSALFEFIGI